jgi:hypothetical protein
MHGVYTCRACLGISMSRWAGESLAWSENMPEKRDYRNVAIGPGPLSGTRLLGSYLLVLVQLELRLSLIEGHIWETSVLRPIKHHRITGIAAKQTRFE